jgi:hypothetical protein
MSRRDLASFIGELCRRQKQSSMSLPGDLELICLLRWQGFSWLKIKNVD